MAFPPFAPQDLGEENDLDSYADGSVQYTNGSEEYDLDSGIMSSDPAVAAFSIFPDDYPGANPDSVYGQEDSSGLGASPYDDDWAGSPYPGFPFTDWAGYSESLAEQYPLDRYGLPEDPGLYNPFFPDGASSGVGRNFISGAGIPGYRGWGPTTLQSIFGHPGAGQEQWMFDPLGPYGAQHPESALYGLAQQEYADPSTVPGPPQPGEPGGGITEARREELGRANREAIEAGIAGLSLPRDVQLAIESGRVATEEFDPFVFQDDGYNAFGYDKYGRDSSGYHKDTGRDIFGFDREGWTEAGVSRGGYDSAGYDVNPNSPTFGFNTDTGLNVEGYDQLGFDVDGYNRSGLDEYGYDGGGYDTQTNPNNTALPGFHIDTNLDREGYDYDGYNLENNLHNEDGPPGFDRLGFDRDGYKEDGYNVNVNSFGLNGFNRQGLDREGYDEDGYNDVANSFGLGGFNRQGWDRQNYDIDGYDDEGYARNGFNEAGFNRLGLDSEEYNESGYNPEGWTRKEYEHPSADGLFAVDEDGYSDEPNPFSLNGELGFHKDSGLDRDGYDREGFNETYNEHGEDGFSRDGLDREGYDESGYNRETNPHNLDGSPGFDRGGLDREGYDDDGYNLDENPNNEGGLAGFNRDGLDRESYSYDGYSYEDNPFGPNGFNRQGLDREGYNASGYDELGLDRDGFDSEGVGTDGYGRDGFDFEENPFGPDGFDRNGFDREGYDKEGYNVAGYQRFDQEDPDTWSWLRSDPEETERAFMEEYASNKEIGADQFSTMRGTTIEPENYYDPWYAQDSYAGNVSKYDEALAGGDLTEEQKEDWAGYLTRTNQYLHDTDVSYGDKVGPWNLDLETVNLGGREVVLSPQAYAGKGLYAPGYWKTQEDEGISYLDERTGERRTLRPGDPWGRDWSTPVPTGFEGIAPSVSEEDRELFERADDYFAGFNDRVAAFSPGGYPDQAAYFASLGTGSNEWQEEVDAYNYFGREWQRIAPEYYPAMQAEVQDWKQDPEFQPWMDAFKESLIPLVPILAEEIGFTPEEMMNWITGSSDYIGGPGQATQSSPGQSSQASPGQSTQGGIAPAGGGMAYPSATGTTPTSSAGVSSGVTTSEGLGDISLEDVTRNVLPISWDSGSENVSRNETRDSIGDVLSGLDMDAPISVGGMTANYTDSILRSAMDHGGITQEMMDASSRGATKQYPAFIVAAAESPTDATTAAYGGDPYVYWNSLSGGLDKSGNWTGQKGEEIRWYGSMRDEDNNVIGEQYVEMIDVGRTDADTIYSTIDDDGREITDYMIPQWLLDQQLNDAYNPMANWEWWSNLPAGTRAELQAIAWQNKESTNLVPVAMLDSSGQYLDANDFGYIGVDSESELGKTGARYEVNWDAKTGDQLIEISSGIEPMPLTTFIKWAITKDPSLHPTELWSQGSSAGPSNSYGDYATDAFMYDASSIVRALPGELGEEFSGSGITTVERGVDISPVFLRNEDGLIYDQDRDDVSGRTLFTSVGPAEHNYGAWAYKAGRGGDKAISSFGPPMSNAAFEEFLENFHGDYVPVPQGVALDGLEIHNGNMWAARGQSTYSPWTRTGGVTILDYDQTGYDVAATHGGGGQSSGGSHGGSPGYTVSNSNYPATISYPDIPVPDGANQIVGELNHWGDMEHVGSFDPNEFFKTLQKKARELNYDEIKALGFDPDETDPGKPGYYDPRAITYYTGNEGRFGEGGTNGMSGGEAGFWQVMSFWGPAYEMYRRNFDVDNPKSAVMPNQENWVNSNSALVAERDEIMERAYEVGGDRSQAYRDMEEFKERMGVQYETARNVQMGGRMATDELSVWNIGEGAQYLYDPRTSQYVMLGTESDYNSYLSLPYVTLGMIDDAIEFAGEEESDDGFYSGGIVGLQSGGFVFGNGDGMSDSIPASIDQHQPANLSTGEFVVPADVVSHIGNGDNGSGADQLYSMLDRIRQIKTGNQSQPPEVSPMDMLPH